MITPTTDGDDKQNGRCRGPQWAVELKNDAPSPWSFTSLTARKASRSSRTGDKVFGARTLTCISNSWALPARSVIGKSWKTVEVVELWPGLVRPEVAGSSPRRSRQGFQW